jgi:hypothetical protein
VQKYGTARGAPGDNTIWRMHIACWIPMATNTHSEYVILIGLPQRYWLHERAPILSVFFYVHCPSFLTYEVECYLVKKRFCALRVDDVYGGSLYCGLRSLGDTTLTSHY